MTIQRQDHIAQDQVDGLSSSLESIPTVTVATSAPANPAVGDIWMNSSNGYQMQEWDGAAWNTIQFGTDAIAAGSVTSPLIAAGTVVAGIVNGTTITGAQFIANGTQGEVLVYDGTPASGSLVLAVSPSSGTDSYGNTYSPGLTLPGFVQGAATQGGINLPDNLSTTSSPGQLYDIIIGSLPYLILQGPYPKTGGNYSSQLWLYYDATGATRAKLNADQVVIDSNTELTLESDHGYILSTFQTQFEVSHNSHINQPLINATDPTLYLVPGASTYGNLKIGSGPTGAYYYEEVTLSGSQSIPSGTVTQVKPYTAGTLYSDYGSAWNLTTGVWTCPVSGPYDWDVVMGLIGSLSNARCFVRVCKTFNTGPFYCVDDVPISAGNLLSATGTFSANAGDQYHVEVYQSTGASHTLDNTVSYVHIGRRL